MDIQREKAFNTILTHLLCDDQEQIKQAYIQAVTEQDPGLRKMVESYLEALQHTPDIGNVFEQSMAQVLQTGSLDAESTLDKMQGSHLVEGTLVGTYRIESVLGEGGMGTVYKARHEAVGSVAALKVAKVTAPDVVMQFERERSLLARLSHGSIARFLDGGVTHDGCPWLAMEYVDGMGLDDYVRRYQPTLKERLTLFSDIARAIRHCHERGVIHCDLKPGNIMVSLEGEVKLIDFGIAVQADLINDLSQSCAVMTPEYASPEQITRQEMTKASDVYSLGVLLYEMLTGRRPYRFEDRSPEQMASVVCFSEIKAPSRVRGKNAAMTRALTGDLDVIVLKALSRNVDERYGSVIELLMDLNLYQAGRPIRAREATWPYRLGKFVKRNCGKVVQTAAIFILASTMIYSRVEAARCLEEAQKKAEEAVALLDALSGSIVESDREVQPSIGYDPSVWCDQPIPVDEVEWLTQIADVRP